MTTTSTTVPGATVDAHAVAGAAPAPATARRRTRLLALGTPTLALWLLYAATTALVPDADPSLTAPTGPVLALTGVGLAVLTAWLAWATTHPSHPSASTLAHRLPWFLFGGAWFLAWQLLTAKSGILRPPYFVAPEVLVQALREDWVLLAQCLASSALLFVTGYAAGSVLGFATGVLMGWSRRADYWLHPILQTVGPVPAASLLPLAILLLPTTYVSAAFIVAFGAWFPMATMTRAGVRAVPRSYIDVARTLGASQSFLVWRVAVPCALPDVLTGLFTGLGTSLAALMTAELVGVDQGLAWYINWVKGWADYPRMYVGLIVLVAFCRFLMLLVFRLRSSLLVWQHDLVRW